MMPPFPDRTLLHLDPGSQASCVYPRELEEKSAAKHSILTRTLGCYILVMAALPLVGLLLKEQFHLDFLSIFAGIFILKGSQAWLRFNLFMAGLFAGVMWWSLVPTLARLRPAVLDHSGSREWLTVADMEFWTKGVAFAGAVTAQFLLAVVCLRSRRLTFWTRQSRLWGGLTLAILAVQGIFGVVGLVRNQEKNAEFEAEFARELALIRRHVDSGSTIIPDPVLDAAIGSESGIERVDWKDSPNSSTLIFQSRSQRSGSYRSDYESFHRRASGEWGLLIIHLEDP